MKKEVVTKEQIEAIRDYYAKCSLWTPQNSQHRSWKFKLLNSTYKKFFIKDEKELRQLLVKYTPLRVYYSSIAILNIQNIKGKKSNTFEIELFKDLIIDIDNKNFEECRKSALEVIKRVGNPDYILKTYKGIHLTYYKMRNQKEIINKIKDVPNIDIVPLINRYNEFSCPLTLNKGRVCTFLTLNQLKSAEISQIESLQSTIYNHLGVDDTSEKPEKANEEAVKQHPRGNLLSSRSKLNMGEMRTEGITLSFSNQVTSRKVKLYIPILIYEKELKKLKEEINYLVSQYDLGNLYVFKSENNIAFISLRVVDERRLRKILNNSRSITKNQQKNLSKIWFNFSEFEPVAKINFNNRKFFRASRKHNDFLIKYGFKTKYNELVGKSPLQVCEVMMK